VDSAHHITAAMGQAFGAQGLARPDGAAVRRIVGLSLETAVAALAPEASPSVHLRLVADYKAAFFELRGQADHSEPLYPGAREAIEFLGAQGLMLGVATGKSQRGLRAVLERHRLARHFITLQTADIAAGKPHPEMLYRAMADCRAEPAATVMIGDTSFDMQMAASAGVAGIGVAWGYHPPHELTASGAQAIAADFAALPALVTTTVTS
jgi:phosphoglycolate phosphatase